MVNILYLRDIPQVFYLTYIYTHVGLPRPAHATDPRTPVRLSGQSILMTPMISGRVCRDRLDYILCYSLDYK